MTKLFCKFKLKSFRYYVTLFICNKEIKILLSQIKQFTIRNIDGKDLI